MEQFNIGDWVEVTIDYAADPFDGRRGQVGKITGIGEVTGRFKVQFADGGYAFFDECELEAADAPAPEAGEPEADELDSLREELARVTAENAELKEAMKRRMTAELAESTQRIREREWERKLLESVRNQYETADRDAYALQTFAQAYMEAAAADRERHLNTISEAQREINKLKVSLHLARIIGGIRS